MSTSMTCVDPALRRDLAETRRPGMTVLLACWTIVVAGKLAGAYGALPDGMSTDDAMRLVAVRDWLGGQSWFDTMQYRLGPAGLDMHWSRLIDLPIAILILGFKLFVSQLQAEKLAMAIWPLLVLLPALAGIRRLAFELGGAAAADVALVLAAAFALLVRHFSPGSLDHHNVQIALLVWAIAWTLRPTPRSALAAGLAMSLSTAIGLEMLPVIAVLAITFGLRWTIEGDAVRRATIVFGFSFAGGLVVCFVATAAPTRWGHVVYDAMSIVHVVAGLLGGVGLAVLAHLARGRARQVRLVSIVGLALVSGGILAGLFPQFLTNPYGGIDPRLVEIWLAHVIETQGLLTLAEKEPLFAIAMFVPLLAGIVMAGWLAMARSEDRAAWAIAALVILTLAGVGTWEVRGAVGANMVAAAIIAAAATRLFPRRANGLSIFGLSGAALAVAIICSPIVLQIGGLLVESAIGAPLESSDDGGTAAAGSCLAPSNYGMLSRLPVGRVLAFIDSGPAILMQSPHTVLASPYHRNNAGNLAMLNLWTSGPQTAQAQLAAHGIDYVLLCEASPEFRRYRQRAPDGLLAQIERDRHPAFLEPVMTGGPIRVFRRIDVR